MSHHPFYDSPTDHKEERKMTETQTVYRLQDTEAFYRSFFEPAPEGWDVDPLESNEPWWEAVSQASGASGYVGLSR